MHIAVTGSSGLLGARLVAQLEGQGHRVTCLVRRTAGAGQLQWDPADDQLDAMALADCDAVVHLAGESIAAGRWNEAKKQRIRSSRVDSTRLLANSLASLETGPRILVSASAVGFYGDQGDQPLDEASPAGNDFLADVCRQWESATQPAQAAGLRVVNLRIGVVLAKEGGALKKMLIPFRFGAGGRVGSGLQFWSWIAIDDLVNIVQHAIACETLAGPVNAVAPEPATNQQFTKALGAVLHRPTIFPLPAFMARLMLGEMADALLLSSARVAPRRLLESGYEFQFARLESALRHVLSKT